MKFVIFLLMPTASNVSLPYQFLCCNKNVHKNISCEQDNLTRSKTLETPFLSVSTKTRLNTYFTPLRRRKNTNTRSYGRSLCVLWIYFILYSVYNVTKVNLLSKLWHWNKIFGKEFYDGVHSKGLRLALGQKDPKV